MWQNRGFGSTPLDPDHLAWGVRFASMGATRASCWTDQGHGGYRGSSGAFGGQTMSEPSSPKPRTEQKEITWDFEGTRRHHIRLGLQMTPAERLRWLEETVDEMQQLQGLARQGRTIGETPR